MMKTEYEIELRNNALLYAALVGCMVMSLVWCKFMCQPAVLQPAPPSEWPQRCEMCGEVWLITVPPGTDKLPPTIKWCFKDGAYCDIGLELMLKSNQETKQEFIEHCKGCKGCRCAAFNPEDWEVIEKAATPPPQEILESADAPPEPYTGTERSGKWQAVKRHWVMHHPACEACGTTAELNVHHIKPFHIYPELELDHTNLITLCRVHHFTIGHDSDGPWKPAKPAWTSANPNVVADSKKWKTKR